ncbi:hypothetical protein [Streptomyces sp. ODS28]|uniref:Acg family FMN-binding oxidoreductase n=1 Tax=Streptomyces sp. ODS28 TaxID=3136688 RepID=UPI0031E643F0
MTATGASAARPVDAALVRELVAAATAAPSIHNTQPWRFRWAERAGVLTLCAAGGRRLSEADPQGRALHVSAGAALFNLRVAALRHGLAPQVGLLPGRDPRALAEVRLAHGRVRMDGAGRPGLYEALWRRHSSRRPFTGAPVPAVVRTELSGAARAEGARLEFTAPEETARLLALTREGERRNGAAAERAEESRRWVEQGAHGGLFGLPPDGLGTRDTHERLPLRDFTAEEHGVGDGAGYGTGYGVEHGSGRAGERGAESFEEHPQLAVVRTRHDGPVDWLRAGQALERALLQLTAEGLCASLFHQALEWPDLRAALRGPVPPADRGMPRPPHVQMLLRIGYGSTRRSSLRAPVEAVLEYE